MAGEIEVVLHARLDEEKLDAFVRGLFQPDLNDPAPGEPQPGRQYADDVIEEGRLAIRTGEAPDLGWLSGQRFVVSMTMQRGAPVVLCSEQEAALVRTLLRRFIRQIQMGAEHSQATAEAAERILDKMGDNDLEGGGPR